MNSTFFFQTQQIPNDTIFFNQLKEQNIFYSYFQVDQNYYLFLYSQTKIQMDSLYPLVQLIQELDSKQRKIRSLRGFFLYALEIMEKGKDYEILHTNLQPFFWKKVKNIIRQNKKGALLEFLFGKAADNKLVNQGSNPTFDDKIQNLQNQINSLEQKIIQLENNQTLQIKNTISQLLKVSRDNKTIQQADSTFKTENRLQSPDLTPNDSKVNSEMKNKKTKHPISESFSEDSKFDFKTLSHTQQYNVQNEVKNISNFITLSKIPEQEKIKIIQRGFQLNQEGKISLKKYYESKDPSSLFQLRGYKIKYETIRRTKL